jgi:squalene cyclase
MTTNEQKAETKQQRQQQFLGSAALSTSGSTLALYLMVSAFLGFFVIRMLTTQEIVVALGTIVLAVVGMWLIALLSKLRLIVRSSRYHQMNGKEKPAHTVHGGIANARYR